MNFSKNVRESAWEYLLHSHDFWTPYPYSLWSYNENSVYLTPSSVIWKDMKTGYVSLDFSSNFTSDLYIFNLPKDLFSKTSMMSPTSNDSMPFWVKKNIWKVVNAHFWSKIWREIQWKKPRFDICSNDGTTSKINSVFFISPK